jgi:hypothetical protein
MRSRVKVSGEKHASRACAARAAPPRSCDHAPLRLRTSRAAFLLPRNGPVGARRPFLPPRGIALAPTRASALALLSRLPRQHPTDRAQRPLAHARHARALGLVVEGAPLALTAPADAPREGAEGPVVWDWVVELGLLLGRELPRRLPRLPTAPRVSAPQRGRRKGLRSSRARGVFVRSSRARGQRRRDLAPGAVEPREVLHEREVEPGVPRDGAEPRFRAKRQLRACGVSASARVGAKLDVRVGRAATRRVQLVRGEGRGVST